MNFYFHETHENFSGESTQYAFRGLSYDLNM